MAPYESDRAGGMEGRGQWMLEDPAACKAEKIAVLKAAAKQHQRYSSNVGCSQGVDRSALAPSLPCVAAGEE